MRGTAVRLIYNVWTRIVAFATLEAINPPKR